MSQASLTPDQLQKYWDACLIRGWRENQTLKDAITAWHSITGVKLSESRDGMRRLPRPTMPWEIAVRVFCASYLPKINDWLWDHEPGNDVHLLRKLQQSKYDTQVSATRTEMTRALDREGHANKVSTAKIVYGMAKYSNRNRRTDWNVTKGADSKIGGRR